ncbi:hypothetical protein VPH35_058217 [Triticum aestivum]
MHRRRRAGTATAHRRLCSGLDPDGAILLSSPNPPTPAPFRFLAAARAAPSDVLTCAEPATTLALLAAAAGRADEGGGATTWPRKEPALSASGTSESSARILTQHLTTPPPMPPGSPGKRCLAAS